MSLLRGADFLYTLRFVRLLTSDCADTKAYELGLIDDNGKKLKSPSTSDEKGAYTTFHRLVFNLKRLLNKFPAGKSKIGSYAAALFLLKEHSGLDDDSLKEWLNIDSLVLTESTNQTIMIGSYTLKSDMPLRDGSLLARVGSTVIAESGFPIGYIFNTPVFRVFHENTKCYIYITENDIDD
jgi:hypothetical protein